jgi:hypothetical protein
LIEAVASVVMLAVLIPPTMWAIREGHKQRVNPMLASRARWLATEKLEDVIADRHSATRVYSYLTSGNYTAEASISGFPGFTRSVAFAETEADLTTAGSGYMRVTVTVNWTDAAGTPRSLSIATIVTDYT